MSLNIVDTLRVNGLSGSGGASGANGYYLANPNGQAGGKGTAGKSVTLSIPVQTFTGDPGGDIVNLSRHAVGGSGGGGGGGGGGETAQGTVTYSSGPGFSRTDAVYGPSGNAGAGGFAGAAGSAKTTFANLVFNMGGGTTSQNTVALQGTAWGGQGGFGGSPGAGGSSNWAGTWISTSSGVPPFSQIYDQRGTSGAAGLDGANGAAGGSARVEHTNLTVTGENVLVNLYGNVIGGASGGGGHGSRSGSGSFAPDSGDGGSAGTGGAAIASVSGLRATVTGGLQLNVYLDAMGGQGARGGDGANPAFGNTNNSNFVGDVGSSLNTYTYGAAGAGGNGGKGGSGTASVTGAVITGSAAVDQVTFGLTAAGGQGGTGGNGGNGVASSSTVNGNYTTVINGTPDGLAGIKDGNGKATVTFSGNTIDLGDGNDTLTFSFIAKGPGAKVVTMQNNVLDGGNGTGDTLKLGVQATGESGFIVDVQNNTLRIGTGPTNAMTGFEIFRGGSGNDRFLDGNGSQTYSGGFGVDRFEFKPGLVGTDRIEGFDTDDVIRLAGFGSSLDSFTDVLTNIAANPTADGVQILTSTGSILLVGMTAAALQSNDFLFV
jgi:hypothetical protein